MGSLSVSNRVYNVRDLEGEWRWLGTRRKRAGCGFLVGDRSL
jgi:hypothetical protein